MPYLNQDKIVAFVPKGRKRPVFDCMICGHPARIDEMKRHLDEVHGIKASAGGYAFFRNGEDKQ